MKWRRRLGLPKLTLPRTEPDRVGRVKTRIMRVSDSGSMWVGLVEFDLGTRPTEPTN